MPPANLSIPNKPAFIYGQPGYVMDDELASDIVMRTAAAPTYFPSWQQYVDGYVSFIDTFACLVHTYLSYLFYHRGLLLGRYSGLFAHDPASEALKLAISPFKLNVPPSDIIMLSFGTGKVNHAFDDPDYDWGYVQWVPKLPALLWDGMIMKSESFCEEMLGDRYHRMNLLLPSEIPMDDPSQIPILCDLARYVPAVLYSSSSTAAAANLKCFCTVERWIFRVSSHGCARTSTITIRRSCLTCEMPASAPNVAERTRAVHKLVG